MTRPALLALTLCCGICAFTQSGPDPDRLGTDEIVGTILHGDFHQRLETVHRLPANLSREQLDALMALLSEPSNQPGIHVLKNDLLNALRSQTQQPEALTQCLIKIFQDTRHDGVIRDYALQHLGAWYLQTDGRSEVQETLWQAAQPGQGHLAGTSLLALHRLANRSAAVDPSRLSETAFRLAQSNTSIHAKITALRICGERRIPGTAQLARQVLAETSEVSLQLSAIATLGEVGQLSDSALLERFRAHPRLMRATEKALEKLQESFGEI